MAVSRRIEQIYIALFGRPADPLGGAYYDNLTHNGVDLTAILTGPARLSGSDEYLGRFTGETNAQIINDIYLSLFGHTADLDGLTFYSKAFDNGAAAAAHQPLPWPGVPAYTIEQIAVGILDGATGTDKAIIDNKTTAALEFTTALDTGVEVSAYSGDAAADAGRDFLDGVGAAETSIPTAQQTDAAIAAIVESSPLNTGVDVSLTAANDISTTSSATLTLSDKNDVIHATFGPGATLTAGDTVHAGAGHDVFQITNSSNAAHNTFDGADVTGVEEVSVRNVGTGVYTFDGSKAPEVTQINDDRGANNTQFIATKLADGTTIGLIGNGVIDQEGDLASGYAASAKTANLELSGGLIDANNNSRIVYTGAGLTTLNVKSFGGSNTLWGINTDAATNLKTVNINALSNLTITNGVGLLPSGSTINVTGTGDVQLDKNSNYVNLDINASKATGAVSANVANSTTFEGGSGNDQVTLSGNAAKTLDGGAGTGDRLVTAYTNVKTAAEAAFIKNFEILQTSGTGVDAIDASKLPAGITLLELNGNSEVSALSSQGISVVGDIQTIALTNPNFIVGGNDAQTVTLDNSILKNADGVDVTGLTVTNANSLTINSIGGNLSNAVTQSNSVVLGANSELTSVTVNGDTSLALSVGGSAIVNSVNASGLSGAFTFDGTGASQGINVTGGSGSDLITGSKFADILTGGAGIDDFHVANGTSAALSGAYQGTNNTAGLDGESITFTPAGANVTGNSVIIKYTLNGVAGQITGIIPDATADNTANALRDAVKAIVDASGTGITTATPANEVLRLEAPGIQNLEIQSITMNSGTGALSESPADKAQVAVLPFDVGAPVAGQTYHFSYTNNGGTAQFIDYTVGSGSGGDASQADVTHHIVDAINAKTGGQATAVYTDATHITLTDTNADNGGFDFHSLQTTGAPILGTSGIGAIDKVTDFALGTDVVTFSGSSNVAGASASGDTALAGTNVVVDANGLVTFAAADDTLAEKLVALHADTTDVASGETVIFQDSGNTYVYAASNTGDTNTIGVIELVGVLGTHVTHDATGFHVS